MSLGSTVKWSHSCLELLRHPVVASVATIASFWLSTHYLYSVDSFPKNKRIYNLLVGRVATVVIKGCDVRQTNVSCDNSSTCCTGIVLHFNLGFRGNAGSAPLLRHFISFRMGSLLHLVSMQLNEQNIDSFPRQSLWDLTPAYYMYQEKHWVPWKDGLYNMFSD